MARIALTRSTAAHVVLGQTAVSPVAWAEKRQRVNEPARLSELVASLSAEGREGFDEARRIIDDRLESKLRKGEISRLAYFRSKNRMTQARLADLSGIPQPNISKLERTGQISLRMANKLAPALGVSVSELLGLDSE